MNFQTLASLLLVAILFINEVISSSTSNNRPHDTYQEDLFIKPLPDGGVLAQFEFKTTYRKDIKSLRWENMFQLFPLSVADMVASTDLEELHLSLTKGNWNYKAWGYSTRPAPSGSQIKVKFSRHNEDTQRSWSRLVSLLSGKFCASLTSADFSTVATTKLALDDNREQSINSSNNYIYSTLPEEGLCTENLTPWKKLLPCYSESGLASLLNAVNIFGSIYSSIHLDLKPVSSEAGVSGHLDRVQLSQSIVIVFDALSRFEGKQSWSLAKIFGNSIQRKCPAATHSRIHVDISDLDDLSKLYPRTFHTKKLKVRNQETTFAVYDVNTALNQVTEQIPSLNIGVKQNQLFKRPSAASRTQMPVLLRTHVAGMGANDGVIVATITNGQSKSLRITYVDVIPHFLRIFMHTMTIRTKSGQELRPDKLNFILSQDKAPTLIEFSVVIPANTEVQISYEFEKVFLRWTEFRPDANKGILLSSASVSFLSPEASECLVLPSDSLLLSTSSLSTSLSSSFSSANANHSGNGEIDDSLDLSSGTQILRAYAKPLLILLPTPDFSMPYNALCFVCSALAAALSPIFTMSTRKTIIKRKKDSTEKQSKGTKDD